MANNKALHRAAKAQQDEFYTQMFDIENELRNYREHFEGKKILCNCDDPYESNFFKYFAIRFNAYRLAKLTATCYAGSPIAHRQLSLFEEEKETQARTPYCAEITELKDYNEDTAEDLQDIRYILEHNVGGGVRKLQGNGDFRSPECIKFLEDSDIVVTNPPFSLLREFIALLIQYDKKFIILANKNAITYKEVFPLFMHNRIWLGYTVHSGGLDFMVPDSYDRSEHFKIDEAGRKYVNTSGPRWFTNLDHGWRHRDMILSRSYERNPELYPHYDNYDAIEVSKTSDIPADYFGVMGVPITFMDKYNPDQFEIVGCSYIYGDPGCHVSGTSWNAQINGKDIYKRLFIRRKKAE
ncbi:MAG: adenine-specific methyltransferase EcoRI family protein [Synergistaceae bacterium]|nr:adenine-specific methyltransferase EcoRI family protein [Synergistaceae bacterium]